MELEQLNSTITNEEIDERMKALREEMEEN